MDRSGRDVRGVLNPAGRRVDEQSSAEAAPPQLFLQGVQVGRHEGLERGVDRRRGRAAVLTQDGVELVGQGHGQFGGEFGEQLTDPYLVGGVHHRPQQADGNGLHVGRPQLLHDGADGRFVERSDFPAVHADPARYLEGEPA